MTGTTTMANFKRRKPKSSRAGCLCCKPQKRQGACLDHRDKPSDLRRRKAAEDAIKTFRCDTV